MAKAKMPPDHTPTAPGGGGAAPAFASTGPAGHRKRMRQRVLAHGAGGLADYELLEMLLFYGVPRRDTKPLAKSLINHFGSFSAVLDSSAEALHGAGAPRGSAALCSHLPDVAACLVRDGSSQRPYLGDWDSLLHYCNTALLAASCPQMRVLYLDSRNALLVDEARAWGHGTPDAETVRLSVGQILQRALEVQASALVTVYQPEQGQDVHAALKADVPFVMAIRKAAPLLAVSVHDHLVIGQKGAWCSARQQETDW